MEERGTALTVVVPVWDDYLHWLGECVGSVWAQRDEVPLRVLVVDNASATPPAGLPDGVEVLGTARRLSLGAARNHGLGRVATPFVAFADADDRFPPGYFAFAVERLRARPGVGEAAAARGPPLPRPAHRVGARRELREGAAPRRRERAGAGGLEAYGGAGRLARRAAHGARTHVAQLLVPAEADARRLGGGQRQAAGRRVRGRAARHPVVAPAAGLVVL